MNAPITRKLRCAVYTRKSSEEGLEQEFNSLHAQREACEAYITCLLYTSRRLLDGPMRPEWSRPPTANILVYRPW